MFINELPVEEKEVEEATEEAVAEEKKEDAGEKTCCNK